MIMTNLAAGLLLVACAIWQVLAPESMATWAREDGPFESVTALLYGLAAICFAIMAKRNYCPPSGNPRWGRFFLIFWVIGTFVIMGEEISWGQRIFEIETPDILQEHNYQNEITLHNLQFIYDNFTSSETGIFRANAFSLLMLGIGLGFPVLVLTGPGKTLIQRFAFPVLPGRYCLLFLGALIYGKVLRDYAINPDTPAEIREFFWGLGIFLFALHGLLRPRDVYRLPH